MLRRSRRLKKLGIEPGKEFNIMKNVNGWMQPSEL